MGFAEAICRRKRVELPGASILQVKLAAVRVAGRWLAVLESGVVKSLRELARREDLDSSYLSRMINLTILAPDIVAAILDDILPPEVTLFDLAVDPPALWEEQWNRIGA